MPSRSRLPARTSESSDLASLEQATVGTKMGPRETQSKSRPIRSDFFDPCASRSGRLVLLLSLSMRAIQSWPLTSKFWSPLSYFLLSPHKRREYATPRTPGERGELVLRRQVPAPPPTLWSTPPRPSATASPRHAGQIGKTTFRDGSNVHPYGDLVI